ncbi:hypothetical protein WJX74_007037 [Apatococcus lobatus]|uniref:ADP-ribosyl-[dinitrogen reductase] hydrolase n=1 Tax=Apatococcus lobatus TaxID=904363 RepID=A0AAW1QXN5_9CHLO
MAKTTSPLDAARGALLGAACGDAAGAVLEFSGHVGAEDAAWALTMPGGGCFNVGKGQFTDDTELALSLANGLLLHDGTSPSFPAEQVAQQYVKWFESGPFDIGNTCRNAFALNCVPGKAVAAQMIAASDTQNGSSKSNGALMRATPLAVFGCYMPTSSLAAIAEQDACLSHPNKVCQSCNAAYVAAVGHLISHPGDQQGALAVASKVASGPDFDPGVRKWLLEDSLDNPAALNCEQLIGYCRWGFTLAFMFLRTGTRYKDAIEQTLFCGGDTDTNAAIVGGLLGAFWGAKAIPQSMSGPVIAYAWNDKEGQGHKRPFNLQGHRILCVADALMDLAQRLRG